MSHTSSESIADALKLLEDAAKLKKEELQSVISDRYTNLKKLIVETEGSLVKSLTHAKDHALKTAAHAREVGIEKTHEITRDVDKKVHQHPWPYIAGAGVVGLLLGAILGRGSK